MLKQILLYAVLASSPLVKSYHSTTDTSYRVMRWHQTGSITGGGWTLESIHSDYESADRRKSSMRVRSKVQLVVTTRTDLP